MRFFCGSIDHETNSFSPIPTSLSNFRENFLYRPSTGEGKALLQQALSGENLLSICKQRGHEVLVGLIAAAHPSAPMADGDYELLRDEILDNLRAAMPVDGVILRLHGAMTAEGYDDCEGDILKRMRALVGPDTPIGVLFDLHGNVTDAMVKNATVLIACKEYPHTDFNDRARELVRIVEAAANGALSPVCSFTRTPLTGLFSTMRDPMRSFVDRTAAFEAQVGILSISTTHGFLWSNSAHVSAGVLVVSDNAPEEGARLADALAAELFAMREQIDVDLTPLDRALAQIRTDADPPLILADVSDNPGGGAPGDSTYLLRALLEKRVSNTVLGPMYDPVAENLCRKAGLGERIPLRIGGKISAFSGAPVDAEAEVIGLTENHWQWAMGARDNLGPAASVRVQGVDIVLTGVRQQALSPEIFTNAGVKLADKAIVALKSAQHFEAAFKPLAGRIVFVDAPGALSRTANVPRLSGLARPLWPIDAAPFETDGKVWR